MTDNWIRPEVWDRAVLFDDESCFVNALREDCYLLGRELARREDCAILGIDPDYVPPWHRRLCAWTRRWWLYHVAWRPHSYREALAKWVAPWLLTDWEARDHYEAED